MLDVSKQTTLLDIRGVCRSFPKGSGEELLVLEKVDLTIHSGEIVGLLGRSGSGKSTLLRIIAGLVTPSAGDAKCRGETIVGPPNGVSMVFQSFALFPWLTVLQNVELGLEALGVDSAERRKRALAAIDLIGLDGFESAYPKELSGGMRQRVGFARALVVHPDLLLMDEPFSALDVLTAETLRTDLIDLWSEGKLPLKSVLMVTHNIEEAVLMCDRILVFSSNPGRVASELTVPFPHPRNRLDPAFRAMVDDIYALMTRRPPPVRVPAVGAPKDSTIAAAMTTAIEPISVNLLAGLLETVAGPPYNGTADLPPLAAELQLEVDEIFPIAEALTLMQLALLADGDVKLTEAGKRFVEEGIEERKHQFAEALRTHVPLAAAIRAVLEERPSHRASAARFRDELEDHMSPEYADATLRAVIGWGRFAELYAYDEDSDQFFLEEEE